MTKLLACLLIISASANAQTSATINNSARLKVFVDCSNTWCDYAFIRTEINIVDFLLDRIAADVHILITPRAKWEWRQPIQNDLLWAK